MNKVAIIGRFTRDPELRQTTNGHTVATFRLAVNRPIKDADGNIPADFLDFVAWDKTGEFVCRNFAKGRMIAVCGSIQTRQYTDRNGNKRTAVEIVVKDTYFCGDKPTDSVQQDSIGFDTPANNEGAGGFDEYEDDDLPFGKY